MLCLAIVKEMHVHIRMFVNATRPSTANYKNLCVVCLSLFYTLKYPQSVLQYYIVEQASFYYHSKFHSDTVFLCNGIAPNK